MWRRSGDGSRGGRRERKNRTVTFWAPVDDLHRLFPADIDLADPELVGVGMVLHRDDLAGDDVVHRLTEVFHLLDLEALIVILSQRTSAGTSMST